MIGVVMIIGILLGVSTPSYQEYARNSNGNMNYALSLATPCPTGKRESGFALAPAGFVLLKQKTLTGEEGATCQ